VVFLPVLIYLLVLHLFFCMNRIALPRRLEFRLQYPSLVDVVTFRSRRQEEGWEEADSVNSTRLSNKTISYIAALFSAHKTLVILETLGKVRNSRSAIVKNNSLFNNI
jgi:hypothetical protein